MANYEELLYLDVINEMEEAEADLQTTRRIFKREDAFDMPDRHFIKLFRLTKNLTSNLIDILENYIEPPTRKSALDVAVKVLIALRFFASGSYQSDIGYNVYTSVSQSSVSRCVNEVSSALNRPEIFDTWVKYPGHVNDLQKLRNEFYETHRFPGVVGCIDCTHVAIIAPKENEHIYVNRKGYHSINVQLVCDSKLNILNVSARYPGSTNDSFIWNNSNLKNFFLNLHARGNTSFHLLGDSGYALRSYMMTPITNPEPVINTPEFRYNVSQMSTRSTIERCNGVLKMRFRCLCKHRVLHYSPEVACKIINACAVLHNMCIINNVPEPDFEEEQEDIDYGLIPPHNGEADQIMGRVNPELAKGRNTQRNIIRNYFD